MFRTNLLVRLTALVLAELSLGPTAALSATYDESRSAAVTKCTTIDPAAYQGGLAFNPEGYRSYYVRSQCFQTAAIQFRDESLCAHVKQRHSLLFSSWGYSAKRCRQLVDEAAAADHRDLEEMKRRYTSGAVRLRDFRLERNGNGRDFDIIPSFEGEYAHAYMLRFEIIAPAADKAPVLLHSSGYHVAGNSNIRIFVRQSDLRETFPELALDRPYTIRATMVLDIGKQGQWSDTFVERVFPSSARSQSVEREVRF